MEEYYDWQCSMCKNHFKGKNSPAKAVFEKMFPDIAKACRECLTNQKNDR